MRIREANTRVLLVLLRILLEGGEPLPRKVPSCLFVVVIVRWLCSHKWRKQLKLSCRHSYQRRTETAEHFLPSRARAGYLFGDGGGNGKDDELMRAGAERFKVERHDFLHATRTCV
eukprot:820968-Rhodomonas_salina.2